MERAVRIGESQQTRRSGKRASAAREPTPAPPPAEGGGEEGASPHATDKSPEALPPPSPDQGRAGGEEAPHKKTLGAPRDPPLFPCPPKGREEEEEEDPGSETPKEVSEKKEVEGAEGTEPEGREDVLHKKNTSTVPPEPKT